MPISNLQALCQQIKDTSNIHAVADLGSASGVRAPPPSGQDLNEIVELLKSFPARSSLSKLAHSFKSYDLLNYVCVCSFLWVLVILYMRLKSPGGGSHEKWSSQLAYILGQV